MKALLDIGSTQYRSLSDDVLPLVAGQLLTPLTRYTRWAEKYAIDNGAYSQFDMDAFLALLEREKEHKDKCLFVCCPDVVGYGRRTLEVFFERHKFIPQGWPVAFVCQDGAEDHCIPWSVLDAIFIGGTDAWKMGPAAASIIKTAKIFRKHTHAGRVNGAERWSHFEKLGVDTCDGSGISRYDHMLERIANKDHLPLLENA